MNAHSCLSAAFLAFLLLFTFISADSVPTRDLYVLIDNSVSLSDDDFSSNVKQFSSEWTMNYLKTYESDVTVISTSESFQASTSPIVQATSEDELSAYFDALQHDSLSQPGVVASLDWVYDQIMYNRSENRRGISVSVLVVLFGSSEPIKSMQIAAHRLRSSGVPIYVLAVKSTPEFEEAIVSICSTPQLMFLTELNALADLDKMNTFPLIWKQEKGNYTSIIVKEIASAAPKDIETDEFMEKFLSSSSGGIDPSELKEFLRTDIPHSWDSVYSNHLSCTFEGSYIPVLGTPGGDYGEFFLALYAAGLIKFMNPSLIVFSEEEICNHILAVLGLLSPVRGLYFHTSRGAIDRLSTEKFGGALTLSDLLFPANQTLKNELLNYLANPRYVGCTYFKAMLENHGEYKLPKELVENATRAFYQVLWKDTEESKKLILDVIEDEFTGRAAVDIVLSPKEPKSGLHPLVRPVAYDSKEHGGETLYIRHPMAITEFQQILIFYFASSYDQHTAMIEIIEKYKEDWFAATLSLVEGDVQRYELAVNLLDELTRDASYWSNECEGSANIVLAIVSSWSPEEIDLEPYSTHLLKVVNSLPTANGAFTHNSVSVVSCVGSLAVTSNFTKSKDEILHEISKLNGTESSSNEFVTITECLNFIEEYTSTGCGRYITGSDDVSRIVYIISTDPIPTKSFSLNDAVWKISQEYVKTYCLAPNSSEYASSSPPRIFSYNFGTDLGLLAGLDSLLRCVTPSPVSDISGSVKAVATTVENGDSTYTESDLLNYLAFDTPKSWNDGIYDSPLSCFEGGDQRAVMATPGGDICEFVMAITSYIDLSNTSQSDVDASYVDAIFANFMSRVPPKRGFYFHTNDAAVTHFKNEFYTKYLISYLPNEVPYAYHEDALNMLVSPPNVGCSHLRFMLEDPTRYKTSKKLLEYVIKSVYKYIWMGNSDSRILYRILGGCGNIVAKVNLSTSDEFASATPLVPTMKQGSDGTLNTSILLTNSEPVNQFREMLAEFFASLPRSANKDHLLDTINSMADVQLAETMNSMGMDNITSYSVRVDFEPFEPSFLLNHLWRILLACFIILLGVVVILLIVLLIVLLLLLVGIVFKGNFKAEKGFMKIEEMERM